MKKSLEKIFKIKKNDIITITGSGGKTSLMYAIAEELIHKGPVLITTSTKIQLPQKDNIKFIESLDELSKKYEEHIICMGKYNKNRGKLESISEKDLHEISRKFDYIIIEGDGSRRLPIKMWKEKEPVIFPETNKVIGVIPFKYINKLASEDFIYNYEKYEKIIGQGVITKEKILKLIEYKGGFFKNFNKEKFIYFSQVDNKEEIEEVKELIRYLEKETVNISYSYGSIRNGDYYGY